MTAATVPCPHCGSLLSVPIGQTVRCPSCGKDVRLSVESIPSSAESAPVASTPAQAPNRLSVWKIVLALVLALVAIGKVVQEVQKHQKVQGERAKLAEKADVERTFSRDATDGQRKQGLIDIFAASGAQIKVLRLTCDEQYLDMRVYEAEVEFLNDCHLKEGRTAYWSPDYYPGGEPLGPQFRKRGKPSVTQFKQGDVKVIRGIIDLTGAHGLMTNTIARGDDSGK